MKIRTNLNLSFLWFITIISIGLGSCKSVAKVPGTNTAIDGKFALKKLQPPEGKALVYIIRNKSMGMLGSLILDIDRKVIGQTKGKQFLYAFLDPGKHLIVSRGENVFELPIKLEAGQTYFIQQKPKMGLFYMRSKLIRLEEEQAKRYLSYCRLSKSNITFEGF
ncbi:MAG: DUF2846 domain-containing protein [Saprospiraceae bacterium]